MQFILCVLIFLRKNGKLKGKETIVLMSLGGDYGTKQSQSSEEVPACTFPF